MYKKAAATQIEFEDFYLPFGGQLNGQNRWVKLAKLIPWGEAEGLYRTQFSRGQGAPAKSLRIALGALIIKERCGFTDEETALQIRENPYLQYFIGYGEYSDVPPFDPSMMVHFRKRLGLEFLSKVNEMIIPSTRDNNKKKGGKNGPDGDGQNRGKLLIDATCAPADIRFPTDVSLLNEAREKLEKYIDILHAPLKGFMKKPRTYRESARKVFLAAIKKKFKGAKLVRRTIGKQLGYIRRNLGHIHSLLKKSSLGLLSRIQYKNLLVIAELFRQQLHMHKTKTHRVDARIVSVTQPHVRPIVRGKAAAQVEFGAKISLSLTNGFARIDHFSWENFHEGFLFSEHLDLYRQKYGHYPESVHVDHIYRTQANRKLCKELGIRISGPPLGRARLNDEVNKSKRTQMQQDLRDRIPVEGKFGEAKRRYGLARIMAKLPDTSQAVIGITMLVMNLEMNLRILFAKILRGFWSDFNSPTRTHEVNI